MKFVGVFLIFNIIHGFDLLSHIQTRTKYNIFIVDEVELLLRKSIVERSQLIPFINQDILVSAESNNLISGRDVVGDAIKNIQRFIIQLDRSDGRPDLSSKIRIEKFCSFLGTCLRTAGGAWTASIGPLEYIGYRLSEYVEPSENIVTINFSDLSFGIANKLADISVNELKSSLSDNEFKSIFWSLSSQVIRLAIRYAIFQDILEGTSQLVKENICISLPAEDSRNLLLPVEILQTIISVDFSTKIEVYPPSSGSTLVLDRINIKTWANNNMLQ